MHMKREMKNEALQLDDLEAGKQAFVLNIQAPVDCACRLRSMGLCEGASVCVLHDCDPVIIQCEQTCMAVCRSLLKHISISTMDQTPDCPISAIASADPVTHATP